MADLGRFREKVREYRLLVGRNQADLASYLDLDYTELSNRLNATKKARLSHENVRAIVRALAEWGAITTREQATELLNLMASPDFDTVDWQARPLIKLKAVSPTSQVEPERLARLRAVSSSPSKFMQERLTNFVGRHKELAEVRAIIDQLVPTGGYLTITGPAGQGKSSLIARLVATYGDALGGYSSIIHHFIPFSPGQDHQTSLLRDLMAQLILKHHLPDFYLAGESRPVLKDYFKKLLEAVAAKAQTEIIFIDGLDQLENELNGSRDLSFLPPNVPAGIVFVLGTRPNDTLKPLELLKPLKEYRLPSLSLGDFELLLARFKVKANSGLVGQLYDSMQHSALYLALATEQLSQKKTLDANAIVQAVSDNPDYLFSVAIERLRQPRELWREVIRPLLGVLLTMQEPLTPHELRQITGVEDDLLREGLKRLGGLVVYDEAGRPYLYHSKLSDYLRQDVNRPAKDYLFALDEEEAYQAKLAHWCEKVLVTTQVQADTQQNYAQLYYLRHLYAAKLWAKLFEVLDKGDYGQLKLTSTLTTASYAQDLELGKAAASRDDLAFASSLELLPKLWHYSLMRCRLSAWASRYSDEVIGAGFLPPKLQAILAWVELLATPEEKVYWLGRLAVRLDREESEAATMRQVLLKAYDALAEISQVEARLVLLPKLFALSDLRDSQLLRRAQSLAQSFDHFFDKAKMLAELSNNLERAGELEAAQQLKASLQNLLDGYEPTTLKLVERRYLERLASVKINTNWGKGATLPVSFQAEKAEAAALLDLARAVAEAGDVNFACQVAFATSDALIKAAALVEIAGFATETNEVAKIIRAALEIIKPLANSAPKTALLLKCAMRLLAIDFSEAVAVAKSIASPVERVRALAAIASQAGTNSESLWVEAYALAKSSSVLTLQGVCLKELAVYLAQAKRTAQAVAAVNQIELDYLRVTGLCALATVLIRQQQFEAADDLTSAAYELARQIQNPRPQTIALRELVAVYVLRGDVNTAESLTGLIPHENEQAKAWQLVAQELASQANWSEARRIADKISDGNIKALTLCYLAGKMYYAGHKAEANRLLLEVQLLERRLFAGDQKAEVQAALVNSLIIMEEWDKALNFATNINSSLPLRQAALTALVTGLLKANKAGAALRIVQKQWQNTTATHELLSLLAICLPLLVTKVELLKTVFNSFEQVDLFLAKLANPATD